MRIWKRLHVRVGGRYRVGEGEVEVDSIEPIGLPDITLQLARESGFAGVLDLLKVANHGTCDQIYLIRFHYVPPGKRPISGRPTVENSSSVLSLKFAKQKRLSS